MIKIRGVDLIRSSKLFGIREGIKFWFNWNIKDVIKIWYWMNINHKPYCIYAGWHCKDKNCDNKHLHTKKEILKHWEEMEIEMDKVEVGKNGLCLYCSEEKATEKITNPNTLLGYWKVCLDCKNVIKYQNQYTYGCSFKSKKMVIEAQEKLLEISKKTGRAIFMGEVLKTKEGIKTSSIIYGGMDRDEK